MASVIKRTLEGGAGFFTANVISRGLGFAFVVVASRVLGPTDFGVLALGLSVMGIARRFAAFGLPNTIPRFLSGQGEKNVGRLYGAILLVGSLMSLVVGIALFTGAPLAAAFFGEPALTSPLRILATATVAGTAYSLLCSVLEAQECAWQVASANTVRGIAKVGLLAPIFFLAQTAESASWVIFGAFVLGAIWAGHHVHGLDLTPVFSIRWTHIQKTIGYSAPLMIVGFSYFLGQQADRLMLGWLSSTSSVGIYTVASKLAMTVGVLQGALYSIFKPIASQSYRNGEVQKVRKTYLSVSRWIAFTNGIVLLVFIAIGPWILRLFGPEYATATAHRVLILLSSFYFFTGWIGPTSPLLQMSDGHKIELFNTLLFIIANISINILLIPKYGSIGAALSTLASAGVRNLVQVMQCWHWYKINPFSFGKLGFLATVITNICTMMTFGGGVISLLTATASIFVLFVIVVKDINKEEQKILKKVAIDAKHLANEVT